VVDYERIIVGVKGLISDPDEEGIEFDSCREWVIKAETKEDAMQEGRLREEGFLDDSEDIRDFEVYAFCVMDDMIHLLLNTGSGGQEEVREILDECMTSMEGWGPQTPEERRKIFSFRRGRLFIQEVRTLEDIEEVIRYIHLLPMEYRYVMNPVDYWWSSFSCYRGTERKSPWKKLVSDERVMEALTEKDVQARTRLLQLHRKAAEAGNPLPDCLKVLPGLKEPDIA
jgi:hypothetical protein